VKFPDQPVQIISKLREAEVHLVKEDAVGMVSHRFFIKTGHQDVFLAG